MPGAYRLVEIVGFEPMTSRMQFTRSQLRYTVSYFLSMPNAYISGISLIIHYVIRGIAKKTGLKITFFSPVFSSFSTQKPLHLVSMTFDFFSLPLYVIIITASTCLDYIKRIPRRYGSPLGELHTLPICITLLSNSPKVLSNASIIFNFQTFLLHPK